MTLILNNDDVKSVLTMEITMKVLEEAYRQIASREAVCRPRAKSDKAWNVRWLSKVAEGQLKSKVDYAAKVRKAYEAGITRKEMGTARVGSPAPDFSALDIDGKPFKLGDVVKKKIVVLTFQVADW